MKLEFEYKAPYHMTVLLNSTHNNWYWGERELNVKKRIASVDVNDTRYVSGMFLS